MIFAATMAFTDLAITGCAMLPASERVGWHPSFDGKYGPIIGPLITRVAETPIPQDLAAFIRQVHLQRSGAPSYLFGETRQTGWRYYYLVALAVKVPLLFWLVMAARAALGRRSPCGETGLDPAGGDFDFRGDLLHGIEAQFGFRYLLPVAPLAIVWISALGEAGRWPRRVAAIGLAGQVLAVAMIHPHELTYFNALAGGPAGGRTILSDSNLDWGQGLKSLVRLQQEDPAYRDLTLYYFGGTEPGRYGVAGRSYALRRSSRTPTSRRRSRPIRATWRSRRRCDGAPGRPWAILGARIHRARPLHRRRDDRDLSNKRRPGRNAVRAARRTDGNGQAGRVIAMTSVS